MRTHTHTPPSSSLKVQSGALHGFKFCCHFGLNCFVKVFADSVKAYLHVASHFGWLEGESFTHCGISCNNIVVKGNGNS